MLHAPRASAATFAAACRRYERPTYLRVRAAQQALLMLTVRPMRPRSRTAIAKVRKHTLYKREHNSNSLRDHTRVHSTKVCQSVKPRIFSSIWSIACSLYSYVAHLILERARAYVLCCYIPRKWLSPLETLSLTACGVPSAVAQNHVCLFCSEIYAACFYIVNMSTAAATDELADADADAATVLPARLTQILTKGTTQLDINERKHH